MTPELNPFRGEAPVSGPNGHGGPGGPLPKAREPAVTTHTILYEFEVFYLAPEHVNGPLRSIVIRAETPSAALWHVGQAGLVATSIGTGRPVVDWSKPFHSRDEAEARACCSATRLSEAIAAGQLRKRGNVFKASEVDAWREKS